MIFGQSVPSAVLLAAEDRGIRQVTYRQENAGGAMADGYARASGRTGVVACQNGPAAALLVAPLAEALKASTAIVAIVQEVDTPASGRNAFQELDHESLFSGSEKWIRRMRTPQRVDDDVDAAFVAAASGRPGPAVLLVPHDLLGEPAVGSERERRQHLGHWPLDQFQPGPAVIEQAHLQGGQGSGDRHVPLSRYQAFNRARRMFSHRRPDLSDLTSQLAFGRSCVRAWTF